MTHIVELPDNNQVEFPDNYTPEQITGALQKQFPSYFPQMNGSIPGQQDNGSIPSQFAKGVGQGLENTGIGILDLLPKVNIKQANWAPDTTASKVGEFGGDMASFFVPGIGIEAGTAKAVSAIPKIANALKFAVRGLDKKPVLNAIAQLSKGAGQGALSGAILNPEDQKTGAIEGAALGAVPVAIGKGFNALRPSNLFKSALSPEELLANLRATEGTKTSLGEVIGNPFLKRQFENVLPKVPFSGANEAMNETASHITEKGNSIVDKLLGSNNPQTYESDINDALKQVYKEHVNTKNALYQESNDIADKAKLKLALPSFAKNAKAYSDALKNTNILKTEPEARNLLSRLENYENPVKQKSPSPQEINYKNKLNEMAKEYGQSSNEEDKMLAEHLSKEASSIGEYPKKYPTLKEANILKGKFGEMARKYGESPNMEDRNMASVFSKLSNSLKNDINSSIKASGNPELAEAYNLAETNYAENFSPFLDKDIHKFANGRVDPEMIIQHFIKTGRQTDRSNLMAKLIDKLPEDKKNLVGYGYLKRAVNEKGNVDPSKLAELLSKKNLGERQFNKLFSDPAIQSELRDYTNLTSKNSEALNLMKNPPTGQRLTDYFPLASAAAGYSAAGPVGAIAGGFGVPLLAKGAVNALTSSEIRKRLVHKMIQNQMKK